MPKDKYTAVWVSHSSISDYLHCPRAYYLKNVYKDPKTGSKIKLITPPLALGAAVHTVLEALSTLPKDERFKEPLMRRFDTAWKKISGRQGGFFDENSELVFKRRGEKMLQRVYQKPGPIANLTIKISQELPYFWLSEEDNIILCGKIDWIEYISESDSAHIIDFKTGKNREDKDSLQLPIYFLLASKCQNRPVTKMSYWYLETDNTLTEMPLPEFEAAHATILEIAKKIKLARQLKKFDCPHNSCRDCEPFERILRGEGEHVGKDTFGADAYILPPQEKERHPDNKEEIY